MSAAVSSFVSGPPRGRRKACAWLIAGRFSTPSTFPAGRLCRWRQPDRSSGSGIILPRFLPTLAGSGCDRGHPPLQLRGSGGFAPPSLIRFTSARAVARSRDACQEVFAFRGFCARFRVRSERDDEPVVRALHVGLGLAAQHVRTHVGENDSSAFEPMAILAERLGSRGDI